MACMAVAGGRDTERLSQEGRHDMHGCCRRAAMAWRIEAFHESMCSRTGEARRPVYTPPRYILRHGICSGTLYTPPRYILRHGIYSATYILRHGRPGIYAWPTRRARRVRRIAACLFLSPQSCVPVLDVHRSSTASDPRAVRCSRCWKLLLLVRCSPPPHALPAPWSCFIAAQTATLTHVVALTQSHTHVHAHSHTYTRTQPREPTCTLSHTH